MMPILRAVTVLTLFMTAQTAFGQFPATRLYSVFPAGGQPGQSGDVAITGGDDLEEIDALLFSHPGITAVPKLNDQKQPVDRTFVVTVAADVPPGLYEVHARGLWGVSNPRRFAVSMRPPVNEVEPNNTPDKPQVVSLNQIVNGRMDGGTDVDWFSFTGQAGQRIVLNCVAATIDSRLNAVMEIFDATGTRRLAQSRSPVGVDTPLVFQVPVDGNYLVRLHDATYRNGNDYFYRLDVHTGPHIAFAWPPVGVAGQTQKVALFGYNLPGGQRVDVPGLSPQPERVEVDVPFPADPTTFQVTGAADPVAASTDAFAFRWASPAGPSNAITLGVTTSPVVLEVEPNDQAPGQAVSVPCEIAGQFGQRGDVDVYLFDAKAKEVLFLEVTAERWGSPVDAYFTVDRIVVGADGKETVQRVAAADDDANPVLPNVFDTQSDDAVLRLEVPEDARYRVTLRDRYGASRGAANLLYSLAIRKEQPDFRLVAVPAAPTPNAIWPVGLRKGDQFGINVLALRQDGFTGPIQVSAVDLPAGVTSPPTIIGEGKPSSLLVLTAAENATEAWQSFRILGKAQVESPAAARSVTATQAQIVEAEKALPALQKPVADATPKRDQAQAAFNQAEEKVKAKPDDAGLVKQRDAAKTALDQMQAALLQSQTNLDAGTKKVADLKLALAKAEQDRLASVQTVERRSRYGIVQFSGQGNTSASARLVESIPIGLMKETAPVQLSADAPPFDVHQGAQVLVPFRLARRNGFEEKVTAAIQNLPGNANIEAPAIAFEKGVAEQLGRFFVKDNAPPGQQVIWFTASVPVSYRRNPEKADRLKAAFDAATAAAKIAMEAAQKTATTKSEATNAANAAAEALKKAQTEKAAAEAARIPLAQKLEQAKAAMAAAEAKAVTLAQGVATAEAAVVEARKLSDADANNAELKQKVATAEQAVAVAKDLAAKAEVEKQTAIKAAADADAALKGGEEKVKTADAGLTKATTDNAAAVQTHTTAEQADQQAQALAKQSEEARKGAEKASNDQANASKPNNVNFITVTQPILINVKPAPFKLALAVPNGGALKRGEKIEIKGTVNRQNGFAGPVKLTFPLPPGVKGLSAADVEIPADKNEGLITLTAAGDANEGAIPNLVIRATAEFQGPAAVDGTLNVKVSP